jgi:hypothetical protein
MELMVYTHQRPEGVPSIMSFFTKATSKSDSEPTPLKDVVESSESQAPFYRTRIIPVVRPSNEVCRLFTDVATFKTPSIANIFNPGPIKSESKPIQTEHPCKHLDGPEYREYIQRIQTRELGGVSPLLRGRAARQLFPYKNLPPLKELPTKPDSDANPVEIVKPATSSPQQVPKIPEGGNSEHIQQWWSPLEMKRFDEFLLGWARWITDRVNGFVRSARCEGKTKNKNSVCDACQSVACDDSFKRAVRRVSGSHGQGYRVTNCRM